MIKDLLFQYNPWWEGNFSSHLNNRSEYQSHLYQAKDRKSIEMITGLRRVGKTALMKLVIEELLSEHDADKILYISLDAYGLEKYSIHEIVDEFRKIHKHSRATKLYLFLDEVLFKITYSQELKNFYDNENLKIYVSASQAGLMKDQRGLLTGRVRLHEILPLKFSEYLNFKNIIIKPSESYLLEKYFEDYLKTGGIPEYVLTGDIGYIEELCDNLLYKDIIAIHNIKDARLIRDYFKLLMERSGKQASVTKMANILGISRDTSSRYFGYFQDTYLIHPLERCGKINERRRSGKKIYAGDVGIRNMVTGFRDKGSLFENLVYFEIKHLSPCYFYQDGIEIDFKTADHLIEVKFNSEMTPKQEQLFNSLQGKKILVDSVDGFLNLKDKLISAEVAEI
ncbi:MAG: ATP-binding protein [Candidatus Cloacimonadales bacterium]|nr:ATP-binding protein [Candidatus Cloacimonadales bacterium]